jgi:hypothetical protein
MKPSLPLKQIALAFLIALLIYIVFYSGIEHRRTWRGPWLVTFTNAASIPTLIINQPTLNIADLKITFPGQTATNTDTPVQFATPQEVPFDVPFGTCLFEDTTFLPGTVVLKLFGHEIQLLPRTLTIDRREYPWQSGQTITLSTTNTSPVVP